MILDTFKDLVAFVGGYTAVNFPSDYLKIAFGFLLFLAAIFIFQMQRRKTSLSILRTGFGYWQRKFGEYNYSIYVPAIIPITFAIGYSSGALGIAGGLLKVPIMVLWFNVPAKIAVATSLLMVGLTGLLGFSGHFLPVKLTGYSTLVLDLSFWLEGR